MKTQELEQVIRDYLKDIYKREYIDKIEIQSLNPGYYIKMFTGCSYQPTIIYAELEDDKFLPLLKEELKNRRYNLIEYRELNKVYPYNKCPVNTSCQCRKTN